MFCEITYKTIDITMEIENVTKQMIEQKIKESMHVQWTLT